MIKYIASGAFGDVIKGCDAADPTKFVAIKAEKVSVQPSQVELESQIYKKANGTIGISLFYDYLTLIETRYLVIDYLGKNLDQLFIKCQNQFSLKTVLMIADQIISRMEYFHSLGYIHRDIKPDNFLIGRGSNSHIIYLSDFGLSDRYCDPKTLIHNPFCKNVDPIGNSRFVSINAHYGNEVSRRDDLESVAYILIFFLKGFLPWMGIKTENKKNLFDQIGMKKMTISVDALCSDIPKEFSTFLREVKALKFDERPNYERYREIFRNLFIESGFVYDNQYDWVILKEEDRKKKLNEAEVYPELPPNLIAHGHTKSDTSTNTKKVPQMTFKNDYTNPILRPPKKIISTIGSKSPSSLNKGKPKVIIPQPRRQSAIFAPVGSKIRSG